MNRDEGLPGTRTLLITWLLLMMLTLLSMVSAQLTDREEWVALPVYGAALILISTVFKVHRVLMVYLNLRVSSAAWRGGFLCVLLLTQLLVFAGFVAARGP